jgi:hypothetical protein
MSGYTIKLDGELICETEWAPMAQAAWHRVSRERNAAQHGGHAELVKDGRVIAYGRPQLQAGIPWPESENTCDLRDVLKALLLLLRHDGWDARELADAMTALGLPTTRARIDALRGSTQGKRTEVTAAEIVVMLSAVLNEYKREEP